MRLSMTIHKIRLMVSAMEGIQRRRHSEPTTWIAAKLKSCIAVMNTNSIRPECEPGVLNIRCGKWVSLGFASKRLHSISSCAECGTPGEWHPNQKITLQSLCITAFHDCMRSAYQSSGIQLNSAYFIPTYCNTRTKNLRIRTTIST